MGDKKSNMQIIIDGGGEKQKTFGFCGQICQSIEIAACWKYVNLGEGQPTIKKEARVERNGSCQAISIQNILRGTKHLTKKFTDRSSFL